MKSTSREFPGFSHIYLSGETRAAAFRVSLDLKGDQNFALTRGEYRPDEPLVCVRYMGKKVPSDVIWTGWAVLQLFSDRVVEILRQHGFTGWSTYPVEVRGKDGEVFPGYHGMAFPGRCGPIDKSRSPLVREPEPDDAFAQHKGMYFDQDTWDGSDLFMSSDGTGFVFITEAVKRAFEKAKVKNISFTPLDEVLWYLPVK